MGGPGTSPDSTPKDWILFGRSTAHLREHMRAFVLAAVVGVAGGLCAIGFQRLTDVLRVGAFGLFGITGKTLLSSAEQLVPWQALLLPAIGAAVAATLLFVVFRKKGSYGIANIMEAVSLRKGDIQVPDVVGRSLATATVIATGGSTGREGPIIQIGSALASSLGRAARLAPRELALLTACGTAAGMAGAYNAPIGAAMFVMEVILGSFVMEQFAPVIVASVMSTLTVNSLTGTRSVYAFPPLAVDSPWEALPIFALGVAAALAGRGFLRALTACEDGMQRLKLPRGALAIVGGLLVGALGIWFPEVWGNGYDVVNERLLTVALPLGMTAFLILGKTLATGITSGSGISGGVFTPTLFVGAALGGAFGTVVRHWFPGVDAGLYALLGMGGVLAATTHAPLTAILILFEMTHDPQSIAPLMLTTITATLFAKWMHADSLYTARLKRRGVRLPDGAEEAALLRTSARDILRTDAPVLPANAPLAKVLDIFLNTRRDTLYVVGDGGRYAGVARIHDVKALFDAGPESASIIALDVAVPVPPVAQDEAVAQILSRFQDVELDEVPVVASKDDPRFVGTLSRGSILAMLRHEVLAEPSRPTRVARRGGAGATALDLPLGAELLEASPAPEDVGRPADVGRWRARGAGTPLVVLRGDGAGGRTALPIGSTALEAGDVVTVLRESGEAR